MQTSTKTRIADWETQPVEDGYAGLHTLAASGFSGVITTEGSALFMLNGRAVGLSGGSIESFEAASLTAARAPHPALSLLFAMQEAGGRTKATYYTNETPIEEAKSTLDSGGFTGYLELSENVLSGDYFAVYHQGRSMSVALVGSEGRLITDEEAESRMHEEVGLYTVETVAIDEIAIPEPTITTPEPTTGSLEPDDASGPVDGEDPTESDEVDGSEELEGVPRGTRELAEPNGTAGPNGTADHRTAPSKNADSIGGDSTGGNSNAVGSDGVDSDGVGSDGVDSADIDPDGAGSDTPESEVADSAGFSGSDFDESDSVPADGAVASDGERMRAGERPPEEPPLTADESAADEPTAGESTQSAKPAEPTAPRDRWGSVIDDPVEDRILAEQQWRETNRIPSIDPERSTAMTDRSSSAQKQRETTPEPGEELLSRALDALETERETREATEKTIEELREEVTQLEAKLASTGEARSTEPGPEPTPARSLDPQTALSGTQLFVRYESKGNATVETAHAGDTDREALAANLRLERHTEFDSSSGAVDGTPFEAFLDDRLEYQFAEWLVRGLVFELDETGHAGSLGALYDALPSIDRIEFQASLSEDSDGFDVICRDRMGEVLFVVGCADGREAITKEEVASLVERATDAKEGDSNLAGAMLVTTSYFDPSALSTAAEATRSGLFGGGSRESYVTISRRAGYHLCLVETHNGAFHLSVPEL